MQNDFMTDGSSRFAGEGVEIRLSNTTRVSELKRDRYDNFANMLVVTNVPAAGQPARRAGSRCERQ
jgi:hypothetical protein